jgi:predicted transcriptional regulator of viral defense system
MGAEQAMLEVANRQHGVVTYAQLFVAGLSRESVRHQVANGWLRRVHRGVYLVGAVDPPLARPMAAVLCVGEGALLSHYPAAVLWGMRPAPARDIHVTVVARDARQPAEVHLHRVKHLHPSDARRRDGIPTTSPARTLLDLATQATHREPLQSRQPSPRDQARLRHFLQ